MVNAEYITTDDDLATLLLGLGFETKPAQPAIRHHLCHGRTRKEQEAVPCLNTISHTEFQMTWDPGLILVENNAFAVFFFDEAYDIFRFWEELEGDITEAKLVKTIIDASTQETIYKRFSGK